jgi:hypothetical protein
MKLKTASLGILLTALAAACAVLGVLLFQSMEDTEQIKREVADLVERTGAEERTGSAPFLGLERCEGGELRYHSIHTPLTFCYPSSMGGAKERETGISPEAREGTLYEISFMNAEDVRMTLQTANFRKTGVTGLPAEVDFACLDLNKSDEELKGCFSAEVSAFERLILGQNKALLVTLRFQLIDDPTAFVEEQRYVIPGILEQPSMDAIISFDLEHADDVRAMLESAE